MKFNSKELDPSLGIFRQFSIATIEMIFINITEYLAYCY